MTTQINNQIRTQMARGGRRRAGKTVLLLNTRQQDEYLDYLEEGKVPRSAAKLVGISMGDVANTREKDEAFDRHCVMLEQDLLGDVEQSLYDNAINEGSVSAQKFILEKKVPQEYGRVEKAELDANITIAAPEVGVVSVVMDDLAEIGVDVQDS